MDNEHAIFIVEALTAIHEDLQRLNTALGAPPIETDGGQ